MNGASRFRRVLKLSLTLIAGVLATTILLSSRYFISYRTQRSAVSISFGKIFLNVSSSGGFTSLGWEVGTHMFALNWEFDRQTYPKVPGLKMVAAPLWVPLLLTSIPAALLWRSDIRRRRILAPGVCASCGYDRRGLAADAKCPECGAAGAS